MDPRWGVVDGYLVLADLRPAWTKEGSGLCDKKNCPAEEAAGQCQVLGEQKSSALPFPSTQPPLSPSNGPP